MPSRARQLLECMEVMFLTQGNNESERPDRSLCKLIIKASEDQLESPAAVMVRTKRDGVN